MVVAVSVRDGLPVSIMVDGEAIELAPSEILVSTQPAEGLRWQQIRPSPWQ